MFVKLSNLKILFVVLFLLPILMHSIPLHAETWFEAYTSDGNVSNTSAFETQKRGYFSGGGFGTRFDAESQPLVTMTPPKFDVGCGGIDSFFGGFSFLKPEKIIQSFKNIMQAAPAFAFKTALSTLCESCSDITDTLKGLADMANQMSMDECAAAKQVGAIAGKAGGGAIESAIGRDVDLGQAAADTYKDRVSSKLDMDIEGWLGELKEAINTNICNGANALNIDMETCRRIHLEPGSLWYKAHQTAKDNAKSGTGTEFTRDDDTLRNIIRSLFGDIYITPASTGGAPQAGGGTEGDVEYVPPVEGILTKKLIRVMSDPNLNLVGHPTGGDHSEVQVKLKDYEHPVDENDSLTGGDMAQAYRDNWSSHYTLLPVSNALVEHLDFGRQADEAIDQIWAAMKNPSQAIDPSTEVFVNKQVFPVYRYLNNLSYMYHQGGSFTGSGSLGPGNMESLKAWAAVSRLLYFVNMVTTTAQSEMLKMRKALDESNDKKGISDESLDNAFDQLNDRFRVVKHKVKAKRRLVRSQFARLSKLIAQFYEREKALRNRLKREGLYAAYSF